MMLAPDSPPMDVLAAGQGDCFLSCDWGTTSCRVRLVRIADLEVLGESIGRDGIRSAFEAWRTAGADPGSRLDYFRGVLRRRVQELERSLDRSLRDAPLVISGMFSSAIGGCELPYRHMPFRIDGSDLAVHTARPLLDGSADMLIISGACDRQDVMRGEETQLVGAATVMPALAAGRWTVVLPGTHSKHVLVEDGRATEVRTFMTGEFFELLATRSVLASVVEPGIWAGAAERAAFIDGVRMGATGNLLNACFQTRSRSLLEKTPPRTNGCFLSGAIIGAELRELSLQARELVVVGSGELLEHYRQALQALDMAEGWVETDAGAALIAGQRRIAAAAGVF